MAERTGQKLLTRDDVSAYLGKLHQDCRRKQLLDLACKGLTRLAFARPNDAANMAIRMETLDDKDLQQLDLFSVSEIKKQKDAGFEIRFADRIKALQALAELADRLEDDMQANDFLKALQNSAGESFDGA